MGERLFNLKSKETEERQSEFGWSYIHLLDVSGPRINVVLHETDIFGTKMEDRASMVIYQPSKGARYVSSQVPRHVLDENRTELAQASLGENSSIHLSLDNEVELKIDFANLSQYKEKEALFVDPLGRTSNWWPAIPFGKYKGSIRVDNTDFQLNGMMYSDMQWGELPIQKWAKQWVWGHFSDSDNSVIVCQVEDKDGNTNSRVLSFSAGGIVEEELVFDEENHNFLYDSIPHKFNGQLEFNHGNLTSFLEINENMLMRRRDLEHFKTFDPKYYRWASSLNTNGKKLGGILEFMRIDRKELKFPDNRIVMFSGMSGSGKSRSAENFAESTGYELISVQDIYRRLAGQLGFGSGRQMLEVLGPDKFMELTLSKVIEVMKSQGGKKWVLDGVSGKSMLEVLNSEFPELKQTVVFIEAGADLRSERIEIRQSLPNLQIADGERENRDKFLEHFNTSDLVNNADYVINNDLNNPQGLSTLLQDLIEDFSI